MVSEKMMIVSERNGEHSVIFLVIRVFSCFFPHYTLSVSLLPTSSLLLYQAKRRKPIHYEETLVEHRHNKDR